jgi:CDGSH-type Zn-finger protein
MVARFIGSPFVGIYAECAAQASNALRAMERTIIKVRESGPYLVRGGVVLTDVDGNEYIYEGDAIALCRCGGSSTKPFCDGTHKENGFAATERAPRVQAEE